MEPKDSGLRQAPAGFRQHAPQGTWEIMETANNQGAEVCRRTRRNLPTQEQTEPFQDLSNSNPKQEKQ